MPATLPRALRAPLFLLVPLCWALTGCGATTTPAVARAPGNPTNCVEDFDPATDYFPEHAGFEHATGVSVTYTRNSKLVEIARPWHGADEPVRVLLVQCGTPVPDDLMADVTVQVPIAAVATFSTTQVPAFALLEQAHVIVAHGQLQYVSTPEVVEAAAEGRVREVGDQIAPDVEALLAASPDVALLSAGVDGDQHRRLVSDLGIPAIPYADWLEETMLGRAEWLKVVALLLNAEGRAEEAFAEIEAGTEAVLARARSVQQGSKVVASVPYQGTWYMPAGDSYVAEALVALGASYPWAGTEGTGALALDLESVIDEAADADVWVGAGSVRGTLEDLVAVDERFATFRAVQAGEVYAEDRAVNAGGGNALFELGAVRPDLVLADLFKILYPSAAEDVRFTFYGRVGSLSGQG